MPQFEIQDFEDVTEGFSSETLIGEGSYGRVYYGVLKDGQPAAIKRLDSTGQPDEEFLQEV